MSLVVRQIRPSDIDFLRKIHAKYYSDLEFIDFNRTLGAFIVESNKGEFILAAGVKPLAEVLLITDKEMPVTTIGRAFVEAQMTSMRVCHHYDINDMVAYVASNNSDYAKHLVKHGFQHRDDISLRMRLTYGKQ